MSMYARMLRKFAGLRIGDWYVRQVAPRLDPMLLRWTGGRTSSVYPTPVMLLTTTGAKTGQPRALPLMYLTDRESLIVIASNYGKATHPAWYRNLVVKPSVDVLAGKRSGRYTATEITDPAERDRAWDLAVDVYPGYGETRGRAGDRTIPLVRLTPWTG
jgi:deazaflavin-dependent oxidoreductase (nitroreductase family)